MANLAPDPKSSGTTALQLWLLVCSDPILVLKNKKI